MDDGFFNHTKFNVRLENLLFIIFFFLKTAQNFVFKRSFYENPEEKILVKFY